MSVQQCSFCKYFYVHILLKLYFFIAHSILFLIFFFLTQKASLGFAFCVVFVIVLLLDVKIWVAGLRRLGTRTHSPCCFPMCSLNFLLPEGGICVLGRAIKGSKKSRAKDPQAPSFKEGSQSSNVILHCVSPLAGPSYRSRPAGKGGCDEPSLFGEPSLFSLVPRQSVHYGKKGEPALGHSSQWLAQLLDLLFQLSPIENKLCGTNFLF